MKAAFKILPVTPAVERLQFLAEIGDDGLSLLYYSTEPFQVESWMNFQFDKNLPATSRASALASLLEREALPAFDTCHIFFNFHETLLVPIEYFREQDAAAMLDCVYGAQPTQAVFSEQVNDIDATNVYRVNDELYNLLNNKFLSAVYYHSNTLLLPHLRQLGEELFCTVYQDRIRVILFNKNRLQIVQYFEYNTPADVAYHLLNVCSQHSVSPAEINLNLSGFIDKDSNLYEELYRYFLNIELDQLQENSKLSEELRQVPPHFFSHLTSLAACVS